MLVIHKFTHDIFKLVDSLINYYLQDSEGTILRVPHDNFKKYYKPHEGEAKLSKGFMGVISYESSAYTDPVIVHLDFTGREAKVKPPRGKKPCSGNTTLAEICKSLGIDSTWARRVLRAQNIEKPPEGWAWPKGPRLTEVTSLLREKIKKS